MTRQFDFLREDDIVLDNLPEDVVLPGTVAVVRCSGDLLDWYPHRDVPASPGVWDREGRR